MTREAGGIAAVTPSATSIEAGTARVLELVRAAREHGTPIRIRGADTWLQAGRPVRATQTLSLADDTGIVEYVPGDLTLTARAGTRLSDIIAATGAHEQWLPLDPWGGDAGTLGATVSTATTGPHAHAMGLPRDVVLGVEMVSGAGHVIRAGGRVVKNVAGFDLTRLAVGSWGTLGVITQVSVRLRARPEHTRTLAFDAATGSAEQALNDLAARLRSLPFTPLACEVLCGNLARRLRVGDRDTVCVRVAGNRPSVDAQTDRLRELGAPRDAPDDVWTALRAVEPDAIGSWRWSQPPSRFGATWTAALRATRSLDGALLHGSPMRGVVRMVVARGTRTAPVEIASAAEAFDGTVAIDALPAPAWSGVKYLPAQDALSRAIRAKFDPAGVLNRGIWGLDP